MNDFKLIDHIQTAVAVIDKNMTVVEANAAYRQRHNSASSNVVGEDCFNVAYDFCESCTEHSDKTCPVAESFKTKKSSSTIHHFWIKDQAVVEEITSTPVVEENGEVNYVIEEFRDITKLLGLNKGIMSICSYCRKVNDEKNWVTFEAYLKSHTGANFSHGICEECSDTMFNEDGTEKV